MPLWKNINFFIEYGLDEVEDRYKIIEKLNVNNFCECQIGKNPEILGEILYVFRTVEQLIDLSGFEEDVEIFIKFGKDKAQNDFVIISFHDAEYDMKLYNWGE